MDSERDSKLNLHYSRIVELTMYVHRHSVCNNYYKPDGK